jgi:hypothetical protein
MAVTFTEKRGFEACAQGFAGPFWGGGLLQQPYPKELTVMEKKSHQLVKKNENKTKICQICSKYKSIFYKTRACHADRISSQKLPQPA